MAQLVLCCQYKREGAGATPPEHTNRKEKQPCFVLRIGLCACILRDRTNEAAAGCQAPAASDALECVVRMLAYLDPHTASHCRTVALENAAAAAPRNPKHARALKLPRRYTARTQKRRW